MAKQLPVQQPARVIHYIDPAISGGDLATLAERELIARRKRDQILYARWLERRAVTAERDRKVRRFLLGFGVTVGLGLLAGIGVLIWLITSAVMSLGAGLLAIPLAILAIGGLAGVGHACVTVVEHRH